MSKLIESKVQRVIITLEKKILRLLLYTVKPSSFTLAFILGGRIQRDHMKNWKSGGLTRRRPFPLYHDSFFPHYGKITNCVTCLTLHLSIRSWTLRPNPCGRRAEQFQSPRGACSPVWLFILRADLQDNSNLGGDTWNGSPMAKLVNQIEMTLWEVNCEVSFNAQRTYLLLGVANIYNGHSGGEPVG